MLSKSEKIAQRIQEIQDFITARKNQDETFAAISQELEQLSNSLKLGKLTVQIVSHHPDEAQALQNFLYTCKTITDFYQFHVTTLASEPEQAASTYSQFHQPIDCDVLCLLVKSKQMLSSSERWFIEQDSTAHIVKRIVVVIPEIDSQSEQQIQANIAGIKAWIQSHSFEPSIEVISLFLSPKSTQCSREALTSHQNAQETGIDFSCQPQLDQLCKSLEALVKRKPEDILSKRIATQILFQLDQIERAFDLEAESLKQEIRQAEVKINSIKQNDLTDELKEQVEQALKQINEDKEKFFKHVRLELNQSKAELLDGFNRKSLLYKIQAFTDNLQPIVIRKGGAKYVKLCSENAQGSADINIDMMHLCYSHLSQWAIQEWQQIYTYYGEGGLSQFFQKTYAKLNFIPSLKLRASLFQPEQEQTRFHQSLKDLVAGVRCESYYKEVSVLNYLIRQIRNQWMGVMFLLTFITMVGLTPNNNRRELIKNIFKPIYQFKNSPVFLTIILAVPLCLVFLILFYNYYHDSQHKLEDEAKRLRKELHSYYQSFAKVSVEKLALDFFTALEAEEERLKRILDSVREHLMAHITEAKKNQLFFKSDLENLIVQQRSLDKARADLQRLKRI